jgi:hypothetical protein
MLNGVQQMQMATNAQMGATDAQSGVCELCLGAQCAGDSNMKWLWQGVLARAHNLLENGWGSMKQAKIDVLERVSKEQKRLCYTIYWWVDYVI